jgi:hypothetical protein
MADANVRLRMSIAELLEAEIRLDDELAQLEVPTVTWEPKVGDIGRYRFENKRHPRFIVVKVLKKAIQIWYSGAEKSQTVPRETFYADCTDVWTVEVADRPIWLKPGAKFQFDKGVFVTLAKIVDDPRRPRSTTQEDRLDLTGQMLEVYSFRADHAACLVPGLKTMVLIPIRVIASDGYQTRTRWDRILDEDELDDYEDYL